MAAELNILVVEDHDVLRELTVALLQSRGHHARGVVRAADVDALDGPPPDLYVIDLNLPGEDGLSLARRLRQARPGVGIVMTTARTQLHDRVAGYGSGADLYLSKPVDPAELLAAVQALGQRLRPVDDGQGLRLDVQGLRLRGPLTSVVLSAAEAQLLLALAQAPQQTLERWQAALHLKLDSRDAQRANLEVRLSQLRKKLREAGAPDPCLQAIRNHGYRLCVQIAAAS